MVIPPMLQELINEDTMLSRTSIEELKEYKKNACEILRSKTQYETAKIVEELIEQEIKNRKIIIEFNNLY